MTTPKPGQPVPASALANIPRLVTAYFAGKPDPDDPGQRVAFGTSGHRGSSLKTSFNENHILATTQAICDYRKTAGLTGPLFIGIDTHALAEPALASAVEVFAANGVEIMIDQHGGYTPTPVISHAILTYNKGRTNSHADGVVITPSHNPPEDGGYKYNPPHGGPADTDATGVIEKRANAYLTDAMKGVARMDYDKARKSPLVHRHDYIGPYVADLDNVVDMALIKSADVKIGIDPLGGAAVHFWQPIAERYGINATIVNEAVDPTFRFMTADWDGKIRMDCSSPFAMASLIAMRDKFDVAFANDTDADRHGIVTPSGLMNPNHFLAAAIAYLFAERKAWRADAAIGKTVVSSSIIDRVARKLNRKLVETPVGFKWFVEGLGSGSFGFAGEESAGASFLKRDGTVWTTDKDGIILGLVAAEILAKTGRDRASCSSRSPTNSACPITSDRSTVPVASLTSITSPTPYWSSSIMNMPDRKSLTMFWAPKPTATPTSEVPAMNGARLIEHLQHQQERGDEEQEADRAAQHRADRLGALPAPLADQARRTPRTQTRGPGRSAG